VISGPGRCAESEAAEELGQVIGCRQAQAVDDPTATEG
jgi:hypothetical protein